MVIFARIKQRGVKKIHLLVLKSYLGPLLLTFAISMFILLMQFIWKYIDDMVGKGLEWHVILRFIMYTSSTLVPLALPLSILLASIMTFGNFGEHYELVAMKTAGISLRKIMMPVIILSVFISFIAFFFSNNVFPYANLKAKSLYYDIKQKKLALDIKEGVFYNGLDGYSVKVGKKESDGITVRDVMVYDHTQKRGNVNLTYADWGKMELSPDKNNLMLTLYDGYNYLERVDLKDPNRTLPFQVTKFGEQFMRFSLADFKLSRTDENMFKHHYQMMNLNQLSRTADSLDQELLNREEEMKRLNLNHFYFYVRIDSSKLTQAVPDSTLDDILAGQSPEMKRQILEKALKRTRDAREHVKSQMDEIETRNILIYKHEIEWHRKFTLSFACLLLFFIGAPLGAIIRKGGLGMPVVVSVLFFVIFHIATFIGEKLAKAGTIDAVAGMWGAPVLFLPVGIFLMYKATTDSPLLEAEAWRKFFNRFSIPKP
jgi:lipopolysaccharide export system permease protein